MALLGLCLELSFSVLYCRTQANLPTLFLLWVVFLFLFLKTWLTCFPNAAGESPPSKLLPADSPSHPKGFNSRQPSSWKAQRLLQSFVLRRREKFQVHSSENSIDQVRWVRRNVILIPNTIGNRKRDLSVRPGGSGDKPYLRKSTDRKAQISPLNWTNAFLICALRSVDFLR